MSDDDRTPIVDHSAVPSELQARGQWLQWDASADTPRRPHWSGNFNVSWSDPESWHTFKSAVSAAETRPSWGIGFVCAARNDDYPRGLYGVIDIDGAYEDGRAADWVPSIKPFVDRGAYIERSPSGEGLHIPVAGPQLPDWWHDVQHPTADHVGIDFLTNKFCTFTGDTFDRAGTEVVDWGGWIEDWLATAYENLTGEDPRADDEAQSESETSTASGEWMDEGLVREALDHIDPDVAYPTWRDIGFALGAFFHSSSRALSVYTDWSSGGSKWDGRAEEQAERIIDDAGSWSYSIATVVKFATENGWTPPSRDQRPKSGAQEAAEAVGDGGGDSKGGDDGLTLRERVAASVLLPADPPDDSDVEPIDEDTARDRLADELEAEYSFLRPREDTRGWRDTLYVYDDRAGIYEPHGEAFIQQETERLCASWANNTRVNEIVGKIERRSRVNRRKLDTAPERLVVANGILDLTTGELTDHTPREYHKTHIDVEYHPDAECPRIDSFLHDIVEGRDVPTLYRLIAHTLYGEYAAEKAAMLLGDGQNGKSVFLSLVERFVGSWNVSNQSLQELNEDEWAPANLVGKLANVHPDMSDQTVETMQEFKKLTGRDTVSANVKFETPVQFENHATLIFACNRMPVLDDDTRGNWRRWILIDFPNTFERSDDDYIEKPQLMEELTAEEELQGLLARCVEEIKRWDSIEPWFPNAPSWREARRQIRRAAEPVYDFAHACLNSVDDGRVSTDDVRRAFQQYSSEEGLPGMSREQLGRKLLNQTDFTIEKKRVRRDGRRVQVYEGIELTSRGRQLLTNDDEAGENEAQTRMGDPQRNARRMVELTKQHQNGDAVSHEFILGLAAADGMNRQQAEHALQKARDQGDLMGDEESGYESTA